ncbi:MAG: hypothetical protein P8Z00_21230, partial [Anaerolineales bacterium]
MKTSKRMRKYGWLCFLLMWIPFFTMFIGMIGVPEGDYTWGQLPILMRASMLLVGSLVVASTVWLTGATI